MSDGIAIAEAAMNNDLLRFQVLSHNLANSATTGYRREISVSHLPPLEGLSFIESLGIQRSMLTPQVHNLTVHEQGSLRSTGSPLDVALEGDAFFVVESPLGEAYTRDGSFRLDGSGALVTATGMRVRGLDGPIQIATPTPLIDREGRIWDGEEFVAQMRLVKFRAPELLEKTGQGLFVSAGEAPTFTDGTTVRQAHFENSNVQASRDMVRLVELTRHFESAQKLVTAYDQILNSAITSIVEF